MQKLAAIEVPNADREQRGDQETLESKKALARRGLIKAI